MTQPRMNRAMCCPEADCEGPGCSCRKPSKPADKLVIEGPALAELKRLLKRRRDLAERGLDPHHPLMSTCERNICVWLHAQHDIQAWGLDDDFPF